MSRVDLLVKLTRCKEKKEKDADMVLQEVNRILNKELYTEKNILHNLKNYNKLVEVINEDEVDESLVFKISEIKDIALTYRLRFVDSQCYKHDFPYESVLKIEHLNATYKKSLKGFKVLSTGKFFRDKNSRDSALLFAPTNLGNYYLVHQWGEPLKWHRKYVNWPLNNIENLFVTLILTTLVITMCLPTYLITLDRKATYWCAYRIGIFFHLLIFNMGVTAYITFAFSKNLGTSIWNSEEGLG
jgi:hypothetical protein